MKVLHYLFYATLLALVYGCSTQPQSNQRIDNPPVYQANGTLQQKSTNYDAWAQQQWLQPFGGVANTIIFENMQTNRIASYGSLSDSAIWTGIYLASQALRYNTTHSEDAKDNVVKAVNSLRNLVDVTGNDVIARFLGPLKRPFKNPDDCQVGLRSSCIKTTFQAEEAYWLGATSRDQYTGWFFGMFVAYQSADSEELKTQIADTVKRVIMRLKADNFEIIPPRGKPAKVASKPDPIQKLAWTSAAAAITGDPEVKAFYKHVKNNNKLNERFYAKLISFSVNKYGNYVGPHLTYLNYYMLIKSAGSNKDRATYLKQFREVNDLYGRDHITLYDYLAMDLFEYTDPAMLNRNKFMLAGFSDAPNRPKPVYPPEASLNKTSVGIYTVNKFIYPKKIFVYPQANEPYPMEYRCPSAYAWQQSPYQICCSKPEDPWSKYQLHCYTRQMENVSFGGVDFLIAYWLGRNKGYISAED